VDDLANPHVAVSDPPSNLGMGHPAAAQQYGAGMSAVDSIGGLSFYMS